MLFVHDAEHALPGGGVRRRLAFGVWEGARGRKFRSGAVADGLWGGGLAPDLEIACAEMVAIERYLRKVVEESRDPKAARVLVASDCLGVLDSVEAAWREGHARPQLAGSRRASRNPDGSMP